MYTLNNSEVSVRARIDTDTEALFTFERPHPRTIQAYFEKVRPRYRPRGQDVKIMAVEADHAVGIVERHLVKVCKFPSLEAFEEPLEEIKKFMAQPRARPLIMALVNEGLFGVTVMERAEAEDGEPATDKSSFGSMFASRPVYLSIREWDSSGEEREEHIRVTMKEATAQQQRQFEQAQPFVRKKKGDLERQEEVAVLRGLFEQRVTSIENADYVGLGGGSTPLAVCTEEAKASWLEHVPYQIIAAVLGDDQISVQLGNV